MLLDEMVHDIVAIGILDEAAWMPFQYSWTHCGPADMITARVQLQGLGYTDAIKVVESGLESGLELIRRYEPNTDREQREVRKAFYIVLATSFVHLFPSKHHPRALYFLNDVLRQDPTDVDGLMGKAYVLQYAEKWEEAEKLFAQAGKQLPDDIMDKGVGAKEENALKEVFETLKDIEDRGDIDKARRLWRIGRCYWDLGGETIHAFCLTLLIPIAGESREEAFKSFITSLKHNREYAPAYTSLGVYHSKHASPPDPTRASKCFQKAFKVDACEAEVARCPVEGFGDEHKEELCGVHQGLSSGTPSERRCPTFMAETRALGRVHELRLDDWKCAYFTGEVQRQAGRLAEALASLQSILDVRPTEPGVLLSVAQTHLDLAGHERLTSFVARAEQSSISCVNVMLATIRESPGYRGVAWKIAADALFELSVISVFADEGKVRAAVTMVYEFIQGQSSDQRAGLFKFTALSPDDPVTGLDLEAAAAACDYCVTVGSPAEPTLPSSLCELAAAPHEWTLKRLSCTVRQASEAANSFLIQALQREPGNVHYLCLTFGAFERATDFLSSLQVVKTKEIKLIFASRIEESSENASTSLSQFLVILPEICDNKKLKRLSLVGSRVIHTELAVFTPLRTFHNLVVLGIERGFFMSISDEELCQLVRAWPMLQVLKISCYIAIDTTAVPKFHGLLGVLRLCPSLTSLALAIDTTKLEGINLRSPGGENFNTYLSDLTLGNSLITSPLNVALILSGIFPCLEQVNLDCWNTAPMNSSWSVLDRNSVMEKRASVNGFLHGFNIDRDRVSVRRGVPEFRKVRHQLDNRLRPAIRDGTLRCFPSRDCNSFGIGEKWRPPVTRGDPEPQVPYYQSMEIVEQGHRLCNERLWDFHTLPRVRLGLDFLPVSVLIIYDFRKSSTLFFLGGGKVVWDSKYYLVATCCEGLDHGPMVDMSSTVMDGPGVLLFPMETGGPRWGICEVDGWADGREFSIDRSAEVVGYYVGGCTKVDMYQIAGYIKGACYHRRVGPDIYHIRQMGGPTYWYYVVDGWAEGAVKDLLYMGGPTVDIYCVDG
ncbi:hypothetical protein F4604DRAFT_2045887 [Suillus subluteus]|nr:hypothetical protein F4604DRAFT_2045887 [Suillus subluteus]